MPRFFVPLDLTKLQDYAGAIRVFERSNELCGDHHVTWFNIGICHYYRVRWFPPQLMVDIPLLTHFELCRMISKVRYRHSSKVFI